MLTPERIMFHYSLLGDSNIEGSFYFFFFFGGGGRELGVKILMLLSEKERKVDILAYI